MDKEGEQGGTRLGASQYVASFPLWRPSLTRRPWKIAAVRRVNEEGGVPVCVRGTSDLTGKCE